MYSMQINWLMASLSFRIFWNWCALNLKDFIYFDPSEFTKSNLVRGIQQFEFFGCFEFLEGADLVKFFKII